MEQLIDVSAEKLGMDPIEIRLKNSISAGEPVRKKSITLFPIRHDRALEPRALPPKVLSSCGLDQCIRLGAELIGWKAKWKGWGQPVEVNESKRRGLGMAVSQRTSGVGGFGAPGAIIKANQDGSFILLTGAGCIGQGIETTQAQIAAEELGVPIDSIIGIHGDTEACPWCMPTTASAGAHMLGLATKAAAADAKRQLCELASEMLGAKPEALDIKDGIIYVTEQPEKRIPIAYVTGGVSPPTVLAPPTITGRAWGALPYSPQASPFLAHFVEVEVDTETGEVKILRYVAVHDSGRIINPEVCEIQVAGGVIQGCGLGLTENLVFDEATGEVLNPDYVDYKTLGALDMPDVEIRFVEVIDPVGAFGVKGLGEAPHVCPPIAIAQAIHNATGIRLSYVPITPEKLLAAWQAKSTKEVFRSDL
jgi:xanthine dehydrogenase molybdenum-binding subunit